MATARRKRKDNVVTMAPVSSPLAAAAADIAVRAYGLYEQRGGQHGHDLDDWLQAERELNAALTHSSAA